MSRTEIQVRLAGSPCCECEFASFLEALTTIRGQLQPDTPFYMLYQLDGCVLNIDHMRVQEELLRGSVACAIVVPTTALRAAVKIATLTHGKKVKVHATHAAAVTWLVKRRKKDQLRTCKDHR
jgi:hypothetical protein